MTDDLPFDYGETPATVNVTTKRCGRHDWGRSPDGDTPCVACGKPILHIDHPRLHEFVVPTLCWRCGKVRDETARTRNRRNRQRGSAFERTVAQRHGGRRTGPLGGRDDVVVGAFSVIQTKKDGSLSLNKARQYLDDLSRTYPDRVALVVHANPGMKPEPVVILRESEWLALHGPATREEA